MEDGAKENTALNIQKPLEILVTDEDKHGTDIACMSDFSPGEYRKSNGGN